VALYVSWFVTLDVITGTVVLRTASTSGYELYRLSIDQNSDRVSRDFVSSHSMVHYINLLVYCT